MPLPGKVISGYKRYRTAFRYLLSSATSPSAIRTPRSWARTVFDLCLLAILRVVVGYMCRRPVLDFELRELELLRLAGHRLIFVCNHKRIPFLLAYLQRYHLRRSWSGSRPRLAVITSSEAEAQIVRILVGEDEHRKVLERGRDLGRRTSAVRRAVESLHDGFDIAVTLEELDGKTYVPRGGALYMAGLTGALLVPVQYYSPHPFVLRTRDRMEVPRGFNSVQLVVGRPRRVPRLTPRGGDAEDACRALDQELQRMHERARADFRDAERPLVRTALNWTLGVLFLLSVLLAGLAHPAYSPGGLLLAFALAGYLTIVNDGLRAHVMEFEETRVRADGLVRLLRACRNQGNGRRTVKIVCDRVVPWLYGHPCVREAIRDLLAQGYRFYIQLGRPVSTGDAFVEGDEEWSQWRREGRVMVFPNRSMRQLRPHLVVAGGRHVRMEMPHGESKGTMEEDEFRESSYYYHSPRLGRWCESIFEGLVRKGRGLKK